MEINQEVACKVLATVDAGLTAGLGKPIPGQMCVEAAVNYALGLPHGDNPSCVSPVLRAFKIVLNDANWSTPEIRAKGLRRLAIAQLGSAGILDEQAFVAGLVNLAQKWAAEARAAAAEAEAARVAEAAAEARVAEAAAEARAAEWAEATRAARVATAAAEWVAAVAEWAEWAERATRAAEWAAAVATRAARVAAAAARVATEAAEVAAAEVAAAEWAAAEAVEAARDKVLAAAAEDVVQLLISLNAPGVQWLYLTEEGKP